MLHLLLLLLLLPLLLLLRGDSGLANDISAVLCQMTEHNYVTNCNLFKPCRQISAKYLPPNLSRNRSRRATYAGTRLAVAGVFFGAATWLVALGQPAGGSQRRAEGSGGDTAPVKVAEATAR